jgi:hypothetical protein
MAFEMGKRLFHGTRDEKVEAATAIVIWASACGFTLSTANYYLQPYLHSGLGDGFSDKLATIAGIVLGALGGLKFSA